MGTLSSCGVIGRTAAEPQTQQETGSISSKNTEVEKENDFVESIVWQEIEKPAARSWTETVLRLQELGETDPVIAEISADLSLYPQNMLEALANNPEMAGFVAGYPDRSPVAEKGLSESEKRQKIPLLLQWDPRWGYHAYGENSCIGVSGCGPTCLSMVLYALIREETLTPDRIAAFSMENGYYIEGIGTSWELIYDFPELCGAYVAEIGAEETAMKAELDAGRFLICAMKKGDFTAAGHFIVVYGYDESGFLVNDPNCVARSRRTWPFGQLQGADPGNLVSGNIKGGGY